MKNVCSSSDIQINTLLDVQLPEFTCLVLEHGNQPGDKGDLSNDFCYMGGLILTGERISISFESE